MRDNFWRSTALGCGADLAPWQRDRGSLTQRIQQRCADFAVRGVCSGLARIARDESALLGIAPQQLAYSREVFCMPTINQWCSRTARSPGNICAAHGRQCSRWAINRSAHCCLRIH